MVYSSEDYYAAVRRLPLSPSNKRTIWFGINDGLPYNVPDPSNMTPEQRAETLEKLRERLGV
jgi:hypothetical protein